MHEDHQRHAAPRRIALLIGRSAGLLDLAGPLQAFHEARGPAGAPAYETLVVSAGGGPVATDAGLGVATRPMGALDPAGLDTLLVVGGSDAPGEGAELAGWLRQAAPRARRIGAICLGAFTLAEAGLLDGRRATTHWRSCEALARRHPAVRVERDVLFVRDGPVWTTAGLAAGIDLALAMIAEDLGRTASLAVARLLVVPAQRLGAEPQLSAELERQTRDRTGRFDALHAFIREHLTGDLPVAVLAEQAGMTPRSLARRYLAATGETPARAVERMRLEAAAAMLEAGRTPVKAVAARTGFGDDERMRRAFLRRLGVTPQDWRARNGGERGAQPGTRPGTGDPSRRRLAPAVAENEGGSS